MSYFSNYFQRALSLAYIKFKAPQLFTYYQSYRMPANAKIVIFNKD